MGLRQLSDRQEIKCNGRQCRRISFLFIANSAGSTIERVKAIAFKKGWTENIKTGKWFCPKCSEAKQHR